MKRTFVQQSFFSVPRETLFAFHERPEAFQILTPDFAGVEVHHTAATLRVTGEPVRFTARFLGIPLRFEMVHTAYEPPRRFVDEQQRGLFSSWRHEHCFSEAGWSGDPASSLLDRITFSHPLLWGFAPFVLRRLRKLFHYRHEATRRELAPQPPRSVPQRPYRVVVTGATGLIGRRLVAVLLEKGVEVIALGRHPARARKLLGPKVSVAEWDFHHPERGSWRSVLGQGDAVVHLAGTPLFSHRWTRSFKQEMERSRVEGTRQLVDAIGASATRPASFICASAVGIYGTDPELVADERAPHADDTLATICKRWEAEARRAEAYGLRVALMRIGIVLSPDAGALKEMLPLFRLGLGGVLGSPHPWINWIHIEDVVRLFAMAVFHDEVSGPLNVTAPNPVPNGTLARTLARVLRRPCLWRFPTPLLRLAIGEAGAFASGGARTRADLAQQLGYRFFFDDLEPALRSLLAR